MDILLQESGQELGDFTCDPIEVGLDEGQTSIWVHAMRPGKYKHAVYGTLNLDKNRLTEFAGSVNRKVRGITPNVNYDHMKYSGKAAGWINQASVDNDGLWLNVDLTEDAASSVRKGEYKYFSPEFANVWEDPQTGKKFKNVLAGGALTNRPFLKDLMPIKLDEESNMEELMKALREHLNLGEDADEDAIQKALTEHFSGQSAQNVNLSEASVNKQDGKAVVTHSGAEGQLEITLEDEEDPLAKLREVDPTLAQKMEDQDQQIKNLQAANKMTEVHNQLDEIGGSEKSLAPSVVNELKPVLVKLSDDSRKTILSSIENIVKDGVVDLSQHSKGGGPTGGSTDPVKKLNDEAERISKERSITYGDAVTALAEEQPALFNEYMNSPVEEEA